MASPWMENRTDNNGLLLKYQLRPPFQYLTILSSNDGSYWHSSGYEQRLGGQRLEAEGPHKSKIVAQVSPIDKKPPVLTPLRKY